MKKCLICGRENGDSARYCAGCGGTQFEYICPNCGTAFSGGAFCPECGVKAGTEPKHCPRCGRTYYTTACPECGYLEPGKACSFDDVNGQLKKPKVRRIHKRRTWLWVLGWIF